MLDGGCSNKNMTAIRMIDKALRTDLRIFLSIVITLTLIGLVFVYSASSVFAMETFGSSFYFVKKHLIGIAIGLAGIITLQFFSRETIKLIAPLLFLGALILTACTLVPAFAYRVHGSSRWIRFFHFTFQPSELLKMGLILFLAAYLPHKKRRSSFVYGYLPILCIILIPSLILLRQPDFGLTITLFFTTLLLLFVSQFEIKHILLTLLSFIPIGTLLILMRPYRLKRVLTFFNPWHDPQGSGFQVIQSLIAIGSGGFWGVGIAQSKQKFFYLPMQHTDFIFAIIAEEAGFIGAFILISLYLALLYSAIKIAQQLRDQFSQLVVIGFTTLVNLQAVINICVASGLLPTKGIALPFVSYGNTALVCNLWMVGGIMLLVRAEIK
ncbi:putative lipid II flippase FtsW [Candidatus Dependentiae bacterium]|nr:MAG: putative lipid II flippase FtsW [Candidatus Dependentiae bacterium]